jgi:hypothetical protein
MVWGPFRSVPGTRFENGEAATRLGRRGREPADVGGKRGQGSMGHVFEAQRH